MGRTPEQVRTKPLFQKQGIMRSGWHDCGHRTPLTDLAVVLNGLAEVPRLEGLVAQAAHSGQAADSDQGNRKWQPRVSPISLWSRCKRYV